MAQSFMHVSLQRRFTAGVAGRFPRDQLISESAPGGTSNYSVSALLGGQQLGLQ